MKQFIDLNRNQVDLRQCFQKYRFKKEADKAIFSERKHQIMATSVPSCGVCEYRHIFKPASICKCIVENHTKCQNIVNLDDIVKNTKTSNAFLEVHETLHEVAENIKQLRRDKNCNLKMLSENRRQIECEIQQVRLNINQHLDKLQENFITELHEKEKRENTKISQLIKTLDEHEIKVAEHQKNITYIKQYESDLQTFLALKQLEADVDDTCQFIDSLSESDTLNRVNIKFSINSSLTDITNIVPVFGKIYIKNSSPSVVITKKKRKQAQLIVHRNAPVSIENIQTELQQTINTIADARGCCILPDCRMVFTYPDLNKVSVVKQDGSVDFSVSVTAAYGVAYNDEDNTMAISSCWNDIGNQITIIDLTKQKAKTKVTPSGQTISIAPTYKTLVYHIYNNAIRAMDLTDESTRDLITENMDTAINIAVSGHKLYYSSCMYHTVVCCDLNGTKQWSFKDTNLLMHPYGISVDNGGNVKQIECEIQQVRLNINQHLDKLQENFIAELHEIEKRENTKISQLIKTLDEHEIKVAEHQKNITYIKQYESDLQTFLALKQLEADVDDTCQFIDSLSETAKSVAYNNEDNSIAISSCWGKHCNTITIIDLTKRKVKKTISPVRQTIGIMATNNKLIYKIYNKAIQVMDLTDETTRDITTENMDIAIRIAISGNKLYYSSSVYHTVVCCNLDGTKQWSFKDENIVKSPCGISADNDGNVYGVGSGTNNVVVVSHDGQKHREFLSLKDVLKSPFAINFGRETSH
ncbi:unnamed protein product [Mytilus coruscus]|uniref:B box-type domain-containing protein n=1 Tax=Mytilus coruscus TaxID=42192 RepID=A0A6J8DGM1_MYTCO|nr:unnamed protein product [Mytilus coruscus]